MAFGLLPALWLWIVVAPVMGQLIFFGFAPMQLILPFVFNVIVWGSFVGWYSQRRLAAPARVRRAVT